MGFASFNFVSRSYLLAGLALIALSPNTGFSEGYQGVTNTSQGKMEMLESIDLYVGGQLQTDLKTIQEELKSLNTKLEKIEPELAKVRSEVEELRQQAVLKEGTEWTATVKKIEDNGSEVVKIKTLVEDWDKGRLGNMEKDVSLIKSSVKSLEGVLNSLDAYKNISVKVGSGTGTFDLPGSGSGSGVGSGTGSGVGSGGP